MPAKIEKKGKQVDASVQIGNGDIDEMGLIVMGSAAVAGMCGVKGPLTTVMLSLENSLNSLTAGVSVGGLTVDASDIQKLAVSPLYGLLEILNKNTDTASASAPKTELEKSQRVALIGQAASNVVEAGLLYTLVKNPETMRTLFDMSKEAVKGAASIAKGATALAGLV